MDLLKAELPLAFILSLKHNKGTQNKMKFTCALEEDISRQKWHSFELRLIKLGQSEEIFILLSGIAMSFVSAINYE